MLEPAAPGTGAEQIGVAATHVYFTFSTDANTFGVAAGPAAGGSTTILEPPSALLPSFSVAAHVAYQPAGGSVRVVLAGTITPSTMPQSTEPCRGVTTTPTNVYCRTLDAILTWELAAPAAPSVVATHVPYGWGIVAAGAELLLPVDEPLPPRHPPPPSTDIFVMPADAGGGAAPLTLLAAAGTYGPDELVAGSQRIAWTNYAPSFGRGDVHVAARSPAAPQDVRHGAHFHVALSPEPDGDVFVAEALANGEATIEARGADGGPGRPVVPMPAPHGLRGLAADATHVYWSASDGRIRRAPRPTK